MKNPRISLRWKVALSVSLLLVGMATVVAIFLFRYEWFFLNQEAEKRIDSLVRTLAVNSRDPLLVGDELRLGPMIQSVMLDPEAEFAFILDHQGKIVFHSDPQRIGGTWQSGSSSPGRQIMERSAPVIVDGRPIGTAVVGLRAEFIRQAMKATALGLLVPLLVGTLVGVFGVILLTSIHVKRIERLESAVQALGAGDNLVQVDLPGGDEVSRLATHFNRMVGQLNDARQDVEESFTQTISALAAAIEAKDAYTRGHCERVAQMSLAIAGHLGVAEHDLEDIRLAAILHDIGKIGVKADIIGKTGSLDNGEIDEMRLHPEIGAKILSSLSFLDNVGVYVKHHHERWDGGGYPDGLEGEKIPLAARIIHLVDAYDAMTSDRPYRAALPRQEALNRLDADRGMQFDPGVVDSFMELHEAGVVDRIRREVEITGAL